MRAVHFICGRDDGVSLNNFSFDDASGITRSGNWDVRKEDASALMGGWMYLHPAKASPSEFGGIIVGFEPVVDSTLKRSNRIIFLVRSQGAGKGQKWRGKAHGMAHSSGLVDADLPHEKELRVSERVP